MFLFLSTALLVYTVRVRGKVSGSHLSAYAVYDALRPLRNLDVLHVDVLTKQNFCDEVGVTQEVFFANGTKKESTGRGASLLAAMAVAVREFDALRDST